MKKVQFSILTLVLFFIFVGVSRAQVRIANSVSNSSAASSSAFIDASSNTTYNSSVNIGKGLLFPRTNLTTFTAINPTTGGLASNYPTRFDGMIVYNTATGTAALGSVAVTPGFYYYYNPGTHDVSEGNSNQGTWIRLTDGNDSGVSSNAYYGLLSTSSPTNTDILGLSSVSINSGVYDGKFDMTLSSDGYYTLALPVAWRNPLLSIDGDETFNIFLPVNVVDINGVDYQVWQTDVSLSGGFLVAIN